MLCGVVVMWCEAHSNAEIDFHYVDVEQIGLQFIVATRNGFLVSHCVAIVCRCLSFEIG